MIKKAVLTGGGRATRLRPITETINKHLIPLANKPMIFHAIEKVVKAGIKEIFINTNPGETELQKVVGNGYRWGIKIKFFEQEGGPQGIAHVVKQAQKFIVDEPFIFYLSDNIILADLDEMIDKFSANNYDCMLAFARVPDPERFGVPFFDENGRLIDVVEKPAKPLNDLAITGIYLYGPKIFFEAFENIKKSDRGEYEISAIHSHLLKTGRNIGYQEITGWWKDTGKPDDLLIANSLLIDQLDFSENGCLIGKLVKIIGNTNFVGPIIIGDNCQLENCQIGPHVAIGDNCILKNISIKNSLIFSDCVLTGDCKLEDSIIGRGAQIIKNDKQLHRLILGGKEKV
jgi:glucose-1-phosphate thymidylyltransferase